MSSTKSRDKPAVTVQQVEVQHEKSYSFDTESNLSDKQPDTTEDSLFRIVLLWFALSFVVLLVWLDEGIVATAIPSITDRFNSTSDIAWYGSAYTMALCAMQLPLGRVYQDFPTKPVFYSSIALFEVGSLIQATSPSSGVFILGRAVAGAAWAGVLTGTLVIFTEMIPQKYMPFFMSSFGWVYGVGIVAGPILGGIIASSSLTWRWCFYINPIASVVAIIPALILLHPIKSEKSSEDSTAKKIRQFDFAGAILFAGAVVTLMLGLQFGSTTYTWTDTKTICCWIVLLSLFVVFVALQWWREENALVPLRIFKQKPIAFGCWYTFAFDGAYFALVYYLPTWFQAVRGLSPQQSAVHMLPFFGSIVFSMILSGILVSKTGLIRIFMLFWAMLLAIGCGFLTTLDKDSAPQYWVTFQILAGLGAGGGTQMPLIAIQDAVDPASSAIALSVAMTCGYLGSSIAISGTHSIFSTILSSELAQKLPNLNPSALQNSGITDLSRLVPAASLERVITIYNHSITTSWYLAAACAAVSTVGILGIQWRRLNVDG